MKRIYQIYNSLFEINPNSISKFKRDGSILDIDTTTQFLILGCTKEKRIELSKLLEIDENKLLDILRITDLMRVDKIGILFAKILIKLNTDSIEKLRKEDPLELSKKIKEINRKSIKIVKIEPSPFTISKWIKQAIELDIILRED